MKLNRRELIQNSSLTLGAFFSSQTLLALADTATTKTVTKTKSFLDKNDRLLVAQISEIIMPRTDTPGAIDVGVPDKMDEIFAQALNTQEQQKIKDGFAALDQLCKAIHKKSFLALDATNQIALVKTLNLNFVKAGSQEATLIEEYQSTIDKTQTQKAIDLFALIKELTLLIFFRSEPGATKVLQYVAIPGRFNGCVPLKEIGRAWAVK
jgi:gluconate 2-dehydrogenase gamma chain